MSKLATPKTYAVKFEVLPGDLPDHDGRVVETIVPVGTLLKSDRYGIEHRWRQSSARHAKPAPAPAPATRFEVWSLFNNSQLGWERSKLVARGVYDPNHDADDQTWIDLFVIEYFEQQMIDVEIEGF